MMSSTIRAAQCYGVTTLAVVGLVTAIASPVYAQQAANPDRGVITIAGGIDFLNQYMFRGMRQNSTEIAIWPSATLGVRAYSGDGALKNVAVNVDFWNSLHTGDTGSHGPTGKSWYESDLSGTLQLGFGRGVSVGTTYTVYTSPNDMFTTVKEVAVKLAVDDRTALGRGAIKPYALVAFEVGAGPGEGQADGGLHAGKYLEVGIAPVVTALRASVTMPVKLGLSLGDYYELAGTDNTFGFVSVGGLVTMPLGNTSSRGTWSVHASVEYEALGETTKVFNGGDDSTVIGSVGVGFSY